MCDSGCSGSSAAGMGENGQEYLAHHNAPGAFQDILLFSSRLGPGSLYKHNNHFTTSLTLASIVRPFDDKKKTFFIMMIKAGAGVSHHRIAARTVSLPS